MLAALQQHNATSFAMPGHKRNTALLGNALPYAIDITEIAGFDNLQNPQGLLRDTMQQAQALWGSDGAYISVNGATGAILAGIRAMTSPGDTVLVARNCHMSVFHAVELCGLHAVLLEPEWLPHWGIYGAVAQATIDQALAQHPNASLCVITSPTYEGVISNIHTDIPLLIDAAHGAHLDLPHADIIVHSLHKTLPALTQTAMLHVCGNRVNREKLEHNLRVFQSSSPSYVLMASIAECIALLQQHKAQWFAAWEERLDQFYAHAQRWQNIELFGHIEGSGGFASAPTDPSKLLIRCDAQAAAEHLRNHGIEPEYAHQCRLLLLTSLCDTNDMMAQLTRALDDLDNYALRITHYALDKPELGELSNGWQYNPQISRA
ncbi:MAG: hypothetical protein FWD06_07470 [Oscillospiraceae bacterium]|nr:hypothetical protein [Oscillospiraceae bacterium]